MIYYICLIAFLLNSLLAGGYQKNEKEILFMGWVYESSGGKGMDKENMSHSLLKSLSDILLYPAVFAEIEPSTCYEAQGGR